MAYFHEHQPAEFLGAEILDINKKAADVPQILNDLLNAPATVPGRLVSIVLRRSP